MSTLENEIEKTRNRWSREALLFCAQHGAKGGKFIVSQWANGETMVGPEGCRVNQEVPFLEFEKLWKNNWKIYA